MTELQTLHIIEADFLPSHMAWFGAKHYLAACINDPLGRINDTQLVQGLNSHLDYKV